MATGYEDDVPPLEDFSELIGEIKTLACAEEDNKTCANNVSESDIPRRDKKESFCNRAALGKDDDDITKTCQKERSNAKSKAETFGGFQRGFLNKQKANSHENNKVSQAKPEEEIPTINPKDPAPNNLRILEVQEAMKTSSFFQNKDWITEDFLKKIEDRPDLLKKLADPRYSKALNHFTSNPQEAWKAVNDNKELQSFIKDLCGLLGEHFTAMAEQVHQSKSEIDGEKLVKSTAPTADEEKMAEIISDPETMNALKDPWISKLIANLKNNPKEARRMLATSRPEVLPKIKKLVDAGILSFG